MVKAIKIMALKPTFEIPSELIEPHARYFMMIQLESLAANMATPEEVRQNLEAVDYFIMCCGGVHSRLAVSNEYHRLKSLNDDEMIRIAKEVYK